MKQIKKFRSFDRELLSNIQTVYSSLHATAIAGYARLDADGEVYSNAFRPIVNSRWFYKRKLRPPRKDFFIPMATMNEDTEEIFDLDEETSDACMKDLMGTSHAGGRCLVNDFCWNAMSRRQGSFGYTLTHQALFFILADVVGKSLVVLKECLLKKDF